MAGTPTVLFVALNPRGYSPLSSAELGLDVSFGLLSHKYAVLSLSAWLKENGCNAAYVSINDFNADQLLLITRAIARHRPDAIGFSLTSEEFVGHYAVIEVLKHRYPEIPVIIGGPHATALPVETLEKFPCIDYVVIGDGEETLTEWLRVVHAGEGTEAMRKIPGLAFRDNSYGISVTTPRAKMTDMDALPHPDYSQIATPGKFRGDLQALPIIFSYGCPFYCNFCSADHGNYRHVSAQRAIEMLEKAIRDFGAKHFVFCDSLWPPSKEWLYEFIDEVERRELDFEFHFETRAGRLSYSDFVKLRKIGLKGVAVGVESGDPDVLKRIRKGITLDMARSTFRDLHRAGIFSRGMFMIGNIGETMTEINETMLFLNELNAPFNTICSFRPLPGSEVYEIIPDDEKDWWMECDEINPWTFDAVIPSICDLEYSEILKLVNEINLTYPLRLEWLVSNVFATRMSDENKALAKRIFKTHLRKYALGIMERNVVFRKIIHCARFVLRLG